MAASDYVRVFFILSLTITQSFGEVDNEKTCPSFCKDPLLNKAESVFCVGECRQGSKKTDGFDKCVEECSSKNPEAKKLCEFNCKLSRDEEKDRKKPEEKKTLAETPSIFNQMDAFMNTMFDHLVDGMKHQKDYGWMGLPDTVKSKFDNFDKVFDPKKAKSDLDIKILKKVENDNGGEKNQDASADKNSNEMNNFGDSGRIGEPVYHRLIIIRKIPIFSIFSSSPADKVDKKEPNVERTKDKYLSSFFGLEKSKDSNVLSRFGFRCNWKRALLFILFTLLFVFSTWYCMVRLLAYRNRWIQEEAMLKQVDDDFEYLIPFEQKMLLIDPEVKLPVAPEAKEFPSPPPYNEAEAANKQPAAVQEV